MFTIQIAPLLTNYFDSSGSHLKAWPRIAPYCEPAGYISISIDRPDNSLFSGRAPVRGGRGSCQCGLFLSRTSPPWMFACSPFHLATSGMRCHGDAHLMLLVLLINLQIGSQRCLMEPGHMGPPLSSQI